MEEPLLGSRRKEVGYLVSIPEDAPSDEEARLSTIFSISSPGSIKERLIFGSSEESLLPCVDNSISREEGEERQTHHLSTESESIEKAVDSSIMDLQAMGSHDKGLRSLRDHTRLELDVLGSEGPNYKSVSPCLGQNPVLNGTGLDESAKDHHHTVDVLSELETNKSVSYTPAMQHLRRIRTSPALSTRINKVKPELSAKDKLEAAAGKHKADVDLGLRLSPYSSMSVVSQAFIGLLLYLTVGVGIYLWRANEFSGFSTHYFIDAIYFCIVTMCTIGYGDITPVTPMAKLFSCAFVLVGFGFIDILLSGMVTYVLDRQEALLLSSVAAGHHEVAKNYLVDTKKGRMRIRSKVALAFGVVIVCIGVGTVVMHFLESLGWLDSFYLSCMSVTTVGYGDHAFKTIAGRLFASVWLLISTLAVARSFIFLAEARIDKRHRLIAKFMLEKEMTAGDLVAADLDNDGCVSKSDFVVYKLKQMGKIVEKDILEVCKQFNRLDTDKCGKITLACLIKLHEAAVTGRA